MMRDTNRTEESSSSTTTANENNTTTTSTGIIDTTHNKQSVDSTPTPVIVEPAQQNNDCTNGNDNSGNIGNKTPTMEERMNQKKLYREHWTDEMISGQSVNIISSQWLRSWKNYVKFEDSPKSSNNDLNSNHNNNNSNKNENPLRLSAEFDIPKPEQINNKELISGEDSEGKPIMLENKTELNDFDIIPNTIWSLLQGWYGGGPAITRQVIEMGLRNVKIVEVRPIIIKIKSNHVPSPNLSSSNTHINNSNSNSNNNNNSSNNTSKQTTTNGSTGSSYDYIIQKSRKSTLNEIRDYIAKKELLDPQKLVLVKITDYKKNKQKVLKKYSSTLDDLKFEAEVTIGYQTGDQQKTNVLSKLSKKFTDLTHHRSKKEKKQSAPSSSSSTPLDHSPPNIHSNSNSSNSSNTSSSSNSSPSHQSLGESFSPVKDQDIEIHRTACGLANLGNTCFMNTSLQCLAHTTPFVKYFLSGKYLNDINKVNPLGMKGQIAETFGKLMRDMWSGSSSVVPKNLKWIIGKYAPQFSGISQQDSQELLSFLLDGLHEDLNKVLKKQYIEEKEEKEQREDSIVAAEQWENHLKRNQSVVVDLFQGQYKSTLVCDKCSKVSITFDPFMFVTLPIPVPTERIFEVLLYRCKPIGQIGPDPNGVYSLNNAMAPIRYCLKLNKRDFIQSLRSELSKQCGIDAPCLALAEIYSNRINTFLSDQKSLTFVRDRDVTIAYELPIAGDDTSRLHVMHRKKNQLLLLPYVLLVKFAEISCKEVYRMVWERVGHRVRRGWKQELLRIKQLLQQQLQQQQQQIPPISIGNVNGGQSSTSTTPNVTHQSSTTNTSTTTPNGVEGSSTANNISSTKSSPVSSPDGSQSGEEEDNSSVMDEDSDELIYPFVLKSTNGYGNNCDRCNGHCNGCIIPCDSRVLKEIFKTPKYWSEGCSNVTIEWRPEIFKYLDDSDHIDNPVFVKQDQSVKVKTDMRNEINLNDCFSLFTRNEKLGPNDTWYCPQCKIHIEGNKKLEIWSAPRILIIHLKRFQFHYKHEKINAYVDFPIDNLDLSKWVLNTNGPAPIYQLYAISNHMGGMGAGHYTATVKNRDRWFNISDSSYHSIDVSNIKTSEAYVLFYELKSAPVSTISKPIVPILPSNEVKHVVVDTPTTTTTSTSTTTTTTTSTQNNNE